MSDATGLNKVSPSLYVANGGGANAAFFVRGVSAVGDVTVRRGQVGITVRQENNRLLRVFAAIGLKLIEGGFEAHVIVGVPARTAVK